MAAARHRSLEIVPDAGTIRRSDGLRWSDARIQFLRTATRCNHKAAQCMYASLSLAALQADAALYKIKLGLFIADSPAYKTPRVQRRFREQYDRVPTPFNSWSHGLSAVTSCRCLRRLRRRRSSAFACCGRRRSRRLTSLDSGRRCQTHTPRLINERMSWASRVAKRSRPLS